MNELFQYLAHLERDQLKPLPPIERWNPPYCGELDLVIRADGVWVHEGAPIARAALVRLFSTVLRKDGDRYFLVTPAEKLGVRVEDAPFLAVALRVAQGPARRLVLTTNVGDEVVADADRPISFRDRPKGGGRSPYIHVRAGLEALVTRSVYYELVDLGETRDMDGVRVFGVSSGESFFPFGPADEAFDEA